MRRLRGLPFFVVLACGAVAGPPDFVEDFNTFDGVSQVDSGSPADTGGIYQAFPAGPTFTVQGFQVDSNSFRGPGLTYPGAEEKALICDAQFASVGNNRHMLAFAMQFSPATGTGGTPDFAEVVAAIPTDANLVSGFYVHYAVAGGKNQLDQQGIILITPAPGFNWNFHFVPAQPDEWHLIVVQYDSPSDVGTADGGLRLWVDPVSPTELPDIEILPASTQLGSPYGTAPLGRFGFGKTADTPFNRRGGSRAGTSTVKVDRVGGWQGYSETRGLGDLSDALTFLNAGSTVEDWAMYEE